MAFISSLWKSDLPNLSPGFQGPFSFSWWTLSLVICMAVRLYYEKLSDLQVYPSCQIIYETDYTHDPPITYNVNSSGNPLLNSFFSLSFSFSVKMSRQHHFPLKKYTPTVSGTITCVFRQSAKWIYDSTLVTKKACMGLHGLKMFHWKILLCKHTGRRSCLGWIKSPKEKYIREFHSTLYVHYMYSIYCISAIS